MSDKPLKKKENMTEKEEMIFENIQYNIEAMTFAIMGQVVQKFEMETLFNTKLPKLKLIFY